MNANLRLDAERIAGFLNDHLTETGVADPDAGRVLPHAYTTDFFAWLCALLYKHGAGERWLARAMRATDAALNIMARTFQPKPSLGSEPEFHWEFKNLALLHVEQLVGAELPAPLAARLRAALLNWRDLNIDSANWTAMRALNYRMRHLNLGCKSSRWRSALELMLVLNKQTPEGLFPDTPRSYSLQYHAYTTSLLALYHRLTADPRVRRAFLDAVRFVADFVDPAGDFNYYGRGGRQSFGYASLILALSEAAQVCGDLVEAQRYDALRERVLSFVRRYQRPNGVLPLVLNETGEKWGWYNYNHLGDYVAFCGVWLLLAASRPAPTTPPARLEQTYTRYYPGLGLSIAARPGWFAVFSAGGPVLSEPAGLVHLWPTGPTCLGGPEPSRAMGVDYAQNYVGPMVAGRPILQRQRARMSADANAIQLCFSLPEAEVKQTYHLNGSLSLEQVLAPKGNHCPAIPLAIASASPPRAAAPLQTQGRCASPAGLLPRFFCQAQQPTAPITTHVRFEVAAAPSPAVQMNVSRARASVRQTLERIVLKALWVLWVAGETRQFFKRRSSQRV